MPMITLKSPGQRVTAFSVDGANVTIAGVQIDCAAEQRDEAVTIEVRGDSSGAHIGGDGPYLATITIPARQYTEQPGAVDPMTGEPTIERVPLPLDPDAVEIILWPVA